MIFDKVSTLKMIDLLKAGNVCYLRDDQNNYAIWEVSYDGSYVTTPIVFRDTVSDKKWPYRTDVVIDSNFWGYNLVNIEGKRIDLEEYKRSIESKSNRHPHYDLILQWAADPKNVAIEFKASSEKWVPVENPTWFADYEYRIKPTTPTLYRQVIYTVISEGPTHHLMSLNKYARFDDFASDEINIVGWYDATAEERFE